MSTQETTSKQDQYTLWQILGIWASVALPMGLILWVIMPILIPRVTGNPGFLYFVLIALGLVWQGVVAYVILRREVRPFTWENLKDRIWLHTPTNPRTGLRSAWMFLWQIPLLALRQGFDLFEPFGFLNETWLERLPFLSPPPYAVIWNLAEPARGQWWLLGVLVVVIIFNYLLGEELVFRGILLPKMNGVFGRWDFIANGVLFATYHLHMIWGMPSQLFIDWIYAWSAKRFKSYWVPVILHGIDGVFLAFIFPTAIMGLA